MFAQLRKLSVEFLNQIRNGGPVYEIDFNSFAPDKIAKLSEELDADFHKSDLLFVICQSGSDSLATLR